MLLIDSREPESVQYLLAKNEQLQLENEQLRDTLDILYGKVMATTLIGSDETATLAAKNERLRARVKRLTKVLDGVLRVRDCQGVWELAGSQEIEDARQALAEIHKMEKPNAIDRQP